MAGSLNTAVKELATCKLDLVAVSNLDGTSVAIKCHIAVRCLCRLLASDLFAQYQVNMTASVVYWSEFLATDPEARVRFPALPE
jgi:ABC-type transporter Mla MlaB component